LVRRGAWRGTSPRVMEAEQLKQFNERLNQWVASQGFWFQVRYSMSDQGVHGRAIFHLLRIAFRLLVLLVVVAACGWIYLAKRTDSLRFAESFRERLEDSLGASELQIRAFSRVQGEMDLRKLAAEGGPTTFFNTLEARNLRCRMGLLDGVTGVWNTGAITMERLDLDLRAGADDAASAEAFARVVFGRSPEVEVNRFDIVDTRLRWGGYSEQTRGAIEGSTLKAVRTDRGWRLSFKGGTFSQNWLEGLEIVELVALCTPEGVRFEQAQLKYGTGTADFTGLRVTAAERPLVEGSLRLRNLDLEAVLPASLRAFFQGSISGDFAVSGSTNTREGVGFEGQVMLDGKDHLVVRERIHLIKALSDIDYARNYRRIDFREGGFRIRTTNGGMTMSDIRLRAIESGDPDPIQSGGLFTLEGQVQVRRPTEQEVRDSLEKGSAFESSPIFAAEDEALRAGTVNAAGDQLTLKRATEQIRKLEQGRIDQSSLGLFDRVGLALDSHHLRVQESERLSRLLRYEGELKITVPGDAFENTPRLRATFPVDPESGRIPIQVPLKGNIYEITHEQAEEIYLQGRR
jgi:hypothetical protein